MRITAKLFLIKRDGDDYIINDPWYGPDKRLKELYGDGAKGLIDFAAVYRT